MVDWIAREGKPIGDIVSGRAANKPDLEGIWKVADSVGRGLEIGVKALSSDDPAKRFWGVIALRDREIGNPVRSLLVGLLQDPAADVRIEVAALLASDRKHREKAFKVLAKELDHPTWAVALRACRAIELRGNRRDPCCLQ